MNDKILKKLNESIKAKEEFFNTYLEDIIFCVDKICECFLNGNKVLICGNGGSSTDSMHFAGELVNRLQFDHKPLPVISLTADNAVITAIGNDYGFDQIFSKQVEALGNENDVIILISTSGNSENVIKAAEKSKEKKLFSIGLLGKDGGVLKNMCDKVFIVNHSFSARIQETHITFLHILTELIEDKLFRS